jgi:DnaJ-class molecular chaperone
MKNMRFICRVCNGAGRFVPSKHTKLAIAPKSRVCDPCGGVGLCEIQVPTLLEFIKTLPKPYA